MFKNVAKIFNYKNEEIAEVRTDEIVIEALCAYRDQLIMNGEPYDLEKSTKLGLIAFAIEDIRDDMFSSKGWT